MFRSNYQKIENGLQIFNVLAKHIKVTTQEKFLKYFECICILLRTFLHFISKSSLSGKSVYAVFFLFFSINLCKYVCICKKRDSRAETKNSPTSKLERSTVQVLSDLQEQKLDKKEHSVRNPIDKQKYVT